MAHPSRRLLVLGLAAAALPLHAHQGRSGAAAHATARKEQTDWGIAGDAAAVRRTVDFRMNDRMRFAPELLEVRRGETLRLRVRNEGKVMHEFVLGTPKALDEHAAQMLKHPGMEHDEPWMAHVPPGGTGEIVWTFNRPGEFAFACLIAGHYQAGMVGRVVVRG